MNLRKQCWCHRVAAIFVSDASATGHMKVPFESAGRDDVNSYMTISLRLIDVDYGSPHYNQLQTTYEPHLCYTS